MDIQTLEDRIPNLAKQIFCGALFLLYIAGVGCGAVALPLLLEQCMK